MSKRNLANHFQLGEYQVEIIVHGFPGKSVCHGSLGFSTIALIRYKDRAERVSRGVDMTYDAADSAASINTIWDLWTRRPNGVLIPGHDMPMMQDNGVARFLGEHEAAIRIWNGEDLNQTKVVSLR